MVGEGKRRRLMSGWKHSHNFNIFYPSSYDQISGKGSSAQLGLANLGGVFIVLLGGMFISIIVAIFEFAWKRRKLLVDENVRETLSWECMCYHIVNVSGVSSSRDVAGLQVRSWLASWRHQAHQAWVLSLPPGLEVNPLQVQRGLPEQVWRHPRPWQQELQEHSEQEGLNLRLLQWNNIGEEIIPISAAVTVNYILHIIVIFMYL